ncbi:proteasome subunit alpha [Verrucomicrobia bacterium SCGC AG-212-E04]|nr:proteasome subunit alpha [Verrucomicrobia bacterium SCGC AG-212-E04]
MPRPASEPVVGTTVGFSDFPELLRARGLLPLAAAPAPGTGAAGQTQATTILAFKFAEGVLVAGDRRATAGNIMIYDRADKVLEIDEHSLMAIAGSPATAWEMARVLSHSFQFYRRTQLQEMTVAAKVRSLSKLLRDNFGLALQGVGAVVPIFATYDAADRVPGGRLYFYDVMGAQFEATDYATTGSGSPAMRGVLYHENTYGRAPLRSLDRDAAIGLALRALDTAAESDTATGGLDPRGKIFPVIKLVTAAGVSTVADADMTRVLPPRHE